MHPAHSRRYTRTQHMVGAVCAHSTRRPSASLGQSPQREAFRICGFYKMGILSSGRQTLKPFRAQTWKGAWSPHLGRKAQHRDAAGGLLCFQPHEAQVAENWGHREEEARPHARLLKEAVPLHRLVLTVGVSLNSSLELFTWGPTRLPAVLCGLYYFL